MLAVTADTFHPDDPLRGLRVGERPDPALPDGWARVRVQAAALNRHDLWSLQGVGLRAEQLPMILGCDAAGVDEDGRPVVVHAVLSDPDWRGDETLDPHRTLLSERAQGTLAEQVVVPRRNLVPMPEELSFEQAACLPTAWLTAYKMIFAQAGVRPGDAILVQGAGGGVASAAILLGVAAGLRVYATSRAEERRERAVALGARGAVAPGERLPERVDAVIETVGAATWSHSLKCLRPGGTLVLAGATSGTTPAQGELNRIFFGQLRVQGSTMGTRRELEQLLGFLVAGGVRPLIDRVLPLADAAEGFAALQAGAAFGKVVLRAG